MEDFTYASIYPEIIKQRKNKVPKQKPIELSQVYLNLLKYGKL